MPGDRLTSRICPVPRAPSLSDDQLNAASPNDPSSRSAPVACSVNFVFAGKLVPVGGETIAAIGGLFAMLKALSETSSADRKPSDTMTLIRELAPPGKDEKSSASLLPTTLPLPIPIHVVPLSRL